MLSCVPQAVIPKKLSGSYREEIEYSNLPWLGRVIESKVTSQLQAD